MCIYRDTYSWASLGFAEDMIQGTAVVQGVGNSTAAEATV